MPESRDAHLTLELFLRALRGKLPLSAVLARAHTHLLALCSTCNEEWEISDDGGMPLLADETTDENATSTADVERSIERLSVRRKLYREAEEDFKALLALPPDEWKSKVNRARTRFHTRAFAQRLLAECKARVRNSPEVAARLARIVPVSLAWATEKLKRPWALALVALSRAHHANALRVSGDLDGAALAFARLTEDLDGAPWECPATRGEIASLYSSLLIEQGRWSEAESLLVDSAAWFDEAGESIGVARALVARGNLASKLGDFSLSYHLHTEAAGRLDATESPSLYLGTVTGRVLALGEDGKIKDARALLKRFKAIYEREGGDYGRAHVTCLAGRLALQADNLDEAKELLEKGRDTLFALGRHHDAAVASLDLTAVHAKAGAVIQVRELARDLVDIFKRFGVNRELMAALRLLAESERIEASTVTLIAELRRGLELRAATL